MQFRAILNTIRNLFIVTFVAAMISAGWFFYHFQETKSKDAGFAFANSGDSITSIAENLYVKGFISSPKAFVIAAKVAQFKRSFLQTGEYEIPQGVTTRYIIAKMLKGERYARKITIPEGLTAQQIGQIVDEAYGLTGEITAELKDCNVLPETYVYYYGDAKNELISRMKQDLTNYLLTIAPSPESPIKDQLELMTLASIVEKETAISSERERVAGVYANRLKKGMMLQADPTVVYAITNGSGYLARALTFADLRLESPYNTYVVTGLPPSPIACPGKAAIFAAAHPEQHNYLYFVANGEGGHTFSTTLKDHNTNVAVWRNKQKK